MNQKISLRRYNKEKKKSTTWNSKSENQNKPSRSPQPEPHRSRDARERLAECRRMPAGAASPGIPAPVGFVPFTHPRYFV